MPNATSYYNQCRHHVFSTYNKYDTEKVYECLYSYKADAPDADGTIEKYLVDAAQLLSKVTGRNIVACGQLVKKYNSMTDEEDFFTQIFWRHPVLKSYLEEKIWEEI